MMSNVEYQVNLSEEEKDNIVKFTRPALNAIKELKDKTGITAAELAPDVVKALMMFGLKEQVGIIGAVSELAPVVDDFFTNFGKLVNYSAECNSKNYAELLKYMEKANDLSEEMKFALMSEMNLENHKDSRLNSILVAGCALGITAIVVVGGCVVSKNISLGKIEVQKWKSISKITPKILKAKDFGNVEAVKEILSSVLWNKVK